MADQRRLVSGNAGRTRSQYFSVTDMLMASYSIPQIDHFIFSHSLSPQDIKTGEPGNGTDGCYRDCDDACKSVKAHPQFIATFGRNEVDKFVSMHIIHTCALSGIRLKQSSTSQSIAFILAMLRWRSSTHSG